MDPRLTSHHCNKIRKLNKIPKEMGFHHPTFQTNRTNKKQTNEQSNVFNDQFWGSQLFTCLFFPSKFWKQGSNCEGKNNSRTNTFEAIQKCYHSPPPRIRLYTSEYLEVGHIFAGILCTHTPGEFYTPQTVKIPMFESYEFHIQSKSTHEQ